VKPYHEDLLMLSGPMFEDIQNLPAGDLFHDIFKPDPPFRPQLPVLLFIPEDHPAILLQSIYNVNDRRRDMPLWQSAPATGMSRLQTGNFPLFPHAFPCGQQYGINHGYMDIGTPTTAAGIAVN